MLIAINCDNRNTRKLRRAMGCAVGKLPITYLGIPLGIIGSCYDVELTKIVANHQSGRGNGPWRNIMNIRNNSRVIEDIAKKGQVLEGLVDWRNHIREEIPGSVSKLYAKKLYDRSMWFVGWHKMGVKP
ncbi:hypothetical protein PIB30_015299 [Stylosanthes scabra]|uniref:Uncharacterized protein n=1 Tax=Stylosanthes scabra TaxID=79078 RepID=A0ABU6Z5Z2_9FABA|nr:hypothetical protein [Stylosanthes scabra]